MYEGIAESKCLGPSCACALFYANEAFGDGGLLYIHSFVATSRDVSTKRENF